MFFFKKPREARNFIQIHLHYFCTILYDAQQSIFDEIWSVSITDETLSLVFYTSSQSKQELRNKQRSKIVKIYVIYVRAGMQTFFTVVSFFVLSSWIISELGKEIKTAHLQYPQ